MIYGCRPSLYAPALSSGQNLTGQRGPALRKVDIREHINLYVDNQIGNRCVGQALAGAAFIANRGQGQRVSPHGIYVGALSREAKVARQGVLLDNGCQMADAVDSLIEVGIYPYDGEDENTVSTTALASWLEMTARKRCDPASLHWIKKDDLNTVKSILSTLHGVSFCMPVDDNYEQDVIDDHGQYKPGGSLKGYHAQVLVGFDDDDESPDLIVWNSWGKTWADGGFSYIRQEWFAENAFDIVGVTAFPTF